MRDPRGPSDRWSAGHACYLPRVGRPTAEQVEHAYEREQRRHHDAAAALEMHEAAVTGLLLRVYVLGRSHGPGAFAVLDLVVGDRAEAERRLARMREEA